MKILCVDDDPVFLDIIGAELARLGYSDVHRVTSGAAALRLVQADPVRFDCFLLDIDMPDISGVQLCAQLGQTAQGRGVPAIMVTAMTDVANVDGAFAAGATDYLTKPLNPRDLRGRLQMAARVAQERSAQGATGPHDFQDAIRLDGAPAFIDHIAMQNYVLKLGSMRMFSRMAVGVHVTNAAQLHASQDAEGFRDTLLDVAEIIAESVGTGSKLVTYAGSGDFVVLLNRIGGFDHASSLDALSHRLAALDDWYDGLGDVAPRLALGQPVWRPILSYGTPDTILAEAAETARRSGVPVGYPAPPMAMSA
jgi:DNA-binding response OmpR family regulator